MKTTVLHILCEGQTEQGFADKVLKPYLQCHGINSVKSYMLCTSRKKNAMGGMISYEQVKRDLHNIFISNTNDAHTTHLFTTMFDYYALPNSFPCYADVQGILDKYEQISTLEKAFAKDISNDAFVPYIQLHEFEALVFCGLPYLKELYPESKKAIEELDKALSLVGNPELIDHGASTAPSKRLITAIESKCKVRYHYDKPKTGKYITEKVGIDELRKQCQHFNEWLSRIIVKSNNR